MITPEVERGQEQARWYAGRVRSWKRAANRWLAALVHLAAISRTVLPYVVQTDFTKTILIVVDGGGVVVHRI